MTGHAFLNADDCGRICLVLFHSLWQMGLAAMLAWLLGRKWRRGSVEWAYWAHVAALVAGLVAIPATYLLIAPCAPSEQVAEAPTIHVSAEIPDAGSDTVFEDVVDRASFDAKHMEELTRANVAAPRAEWSWSALAPWVVGVYVFGAVMMFVRLAIGIARTERMRRRALPVATGEIARRAAQLATRWRMKIQPALGQLDSIVVPTVIGAIRPMILLPGMALTSLTHEELELILAHELAHVRRYDLWVNLLQRIGEAALFFNPAMWYLSRRISALREYCCDELVCGLQDEASEEARTNYAVALLRAVEIARPGLATNPGIAALASDGGSPSELRRRVARLLGEPCYEPLRVSRGGLICAVAFAMAMFVGPAWVRHSAYAAADSEGAAAKTEDNGALDDVNKLLTKVGKSKQQILKLPVRVVSPEGKPVANAEVKPWALRSSQGHGWWGDDDKRSGIAPQAVVTDADGKAVVLYPNFRDATEKVTTIGVSVRVDHPDFAYLDAEHIDVPLETKGPYEIKLKPGVDIEVRPMVNGKPMPLDNLYAVWSSGRSWQPSNAPEKTGDGTLRLRGLAPGKNSVLLVKMDGERATYFSKIVDFELNAGEPKTMDVALESSVTVRGKVADDVPRPIRAGWIKTSTLEPPREERNQRAGWYSWSPIEKDGTFTIDGWPAHEPIELTSVCDGYVATNGKAPDVVKNPPDPAHDPYQRPQVFEPQDKEPIEVPMTLMSKCTITAVDEDNKPVAGVTVVACPNVQWWNGGSQIYAEPLVKGERVLKTRDYDTAIDTGVYPDPFRVVTDAKGQLTMYLPGRSQDLGLISDVYELPIFLGVREVRERLTVGEPKEITLHLQPSGTEQLGDWDKLAGVVFGCSTREGRRICALPEVRKKMDEFEQRFRDGKSQHDPQLLSEAYTMVADAFVGVGDKEEAAKWRAKAAVEAAKVKERKSN